MTEEIIVSNEVPPSLPFPSPYENGVDRETNYHGTLPYQVWVGTLLLSLLDLFYFPESKGFNCPYSCPIFLKHDVIVLQIQGTKTKSNFMHFGIEKSSIQDTRVYVYNGLMNVKR
jgi:hypothetical protein